MGISTIQIVYGNCPVIVKAKRLATTDLLTITVLMNNTFTNDILTIMS